MGEFTCEKSPFLPQGHPQQKGCSSELSCLSMESWHLPAWLLLSGKWLPWPDPLERSLSDLSGRLLSSEAPTPETQGKAVFHRPLGASGLEE